MPLAISRIDLFQLNFVPIGTRLIDINYLKFVIHVAKLMFRCYTQFVALYEIWKSISYFLLLLFFTVYFIIRLVV